MAHRVLRLPDVKARTGLSRSTIYLRVSNGEFPQPVSLGGRSVGWLEHEIDEWITSQVAARDEAIEVNQGQCDQGQG